jgi:SAM-dependent methyltransferase
MDEFTYDSIAASYADGVDRAPHNALYERPAMLGLLPDIEGLRILDAGCGSGWYAEQLLERGAVVDAFDASPAMVEHARRRLAASSPVDRLTIQVAQLGSRLPFGDSTFDGAVSPLVLHYLPNWRPALSEVKRVLKPGGWFQFSTHHPSADAALFQTQEYFATERVVDHWKWAGRVEFYRRSLTEIFASILDTGFAVEMVVEPVPTEDLKNAEPDTYAKLMNQPAFIIFRVRAS